MNGSGTVWIRIKHRFGARLSEWSLAVHTLLFGYVLLIADGIFTQPAWLGFAQHIEQSTLGWFMFLLGVLRLGGLAVNGARKHVTPYIRIVSAACGFVIFSLITAGFAMGYTTTSLAIYPIFAIVELFNIYRASSDAGEAHCDT